MRYNVEEPAHYPDSIIYRGGGIETFVYSNIQMYFESTTNDKQGMHLNRHPSSVDSVVRSLAATFACEGKMIPSDIEIALKS